jgi:hypothetical protein
MYIVKSPYAVKRYTASVARERLAEALDHADRGIPVVIERKGVRYRISRERQGPRTHRTRKPRLEIIDRAVADGQWTWEPGPSGFAFRRQRRS